MFTKKSLLTLAAVLMLAVLALVGAVTYTVLKPAAAATSAIQAIPIQLDTTTSTAATTSSTNTATQPTSDDSELLVFEINQDASTATFEIDEVLNGSPFHVVGTTSQVAGQIAIDPSNPSATQLGTIQINARTFATDSSQRDRAIQNVILSTNNYEYITFEPSEIVGLPSDATVGESYTFEVKGNLTIRDTTREATFTVTVTPTADNHIQGTATTTINYADWGVSIPNVPFVASVDEDVQLTLAFTATA